MLWFFGPEILNFDRSLDAPYGEQVRLSPLVSRLLAPNPGPFTFKGTGVHIVGAGQNAASRELLQLPRINLAIDALSRAYDYVVLDAGTAADLPASVIAARAHAVIIPDPAITATARDMMRSQLLASGFSGVTILTTPLTAMDFGVPDERIAAA